MKRLPKIICLILSVVMVFGVVATVIACKKDPDKVTVTYMLISSEKPTDDDGNINYVEGGTYEVNKGSKINNTQMPTDPKPDENGLFDFWAAEDSLTVNFVETANVDADITLYPVYRERKSNEVVVHFDTEGGSRVPTQVVTSGNKATKPGNPSIAGGTFVKWIGGATGTFDFNDTINADTFLKAEWEIGKNQVLVLSSGAFDGVFSPFFSTSTYDGDVQGMTQIGMLSANAKGNVYVGEDVPTMVKAYNVTTMLYKDNDWTTDYTQDDVNSVNQKDPNQYRTEYEFVIKNGIEDSEGNRMGIKDVLFNLYVYLDPMYTGSSTIYSTNIMGLNAYRTQNASMDDSQTSNDGAALLEARGRMNLLRDYFHADKMTSTRSGIAGTPEEEELLRDVWDLRLMFWEELCSDWNSVYQLDEVTSKVDGKKYVEGYEEYGFTEKWEVFLFNCGIIRAEYKTDGTVDKEKPGTEHGIYYGSTKEWHHDPLSLIKIVFNDRVGILDDTERGNELANLDGKPIIDFKVDPVTFKYIESNDNIPFGSIAEDKREDINTFVGRILDPSVSVGISGSNNVASLTYYWTCGQKLLSEMVVSEKSKVFAGMGTGGRNVDRISGITVEQTNGSFTDVNNNEITLTEKHDILKIVVVGVDPKAIWNFSFAVAPMSYYSDPDSLGGTDYNTTKHGHGAFKYPGVTDPITEVGPSYRSHLGFMQLDYKYFKQVLKHQKVIMLPVGAGPFKASNINNTTGRPSGSDFAKDNIVYFRRNEKFKTTGASMNNAKFEFLKYQVVDPAKILESITTGTVHYGDPQAKEQSYNTAQRNPNLQVAMVTNNGYGYIGVNAKFVPDIEVRKAIMVAMNTKYIESYYPSDFASVLTRPMSTVSDYYPKSGIGDAYPFEDETEAVKTIKELIKDKYNESSPKSEGAYSRTLSTGEVHKLKYTFTVAGSTDDHPAFNMFLNAKKVLEKCGFVITVKNDAQALSKLSNGELMVWAAAWSSAIDPDMYQVYHKNSQAQSVNNWGYPYLLQYGDDVELGILDELSEQIDAGRQTVDVSKRKTIYKTALDLVMDLAIEYPYYQRKNMIVYNKTKINPDSVNKNPTAYLGVIDQIWKISLLK